MDDLTRTQPPRAADPVALTYGFHVFSRETLIRKLDGLSDAEQRRQVLPSGASMLGLFKHCIHVERLWIAYGMGGLDPETLWTAEELIDEDDEADWKVAPDESFESLVALAKAEAVRSDAIIPGLRWEEIGKSPRSIREGLTVGWILSHLVWEIGRHLGQLDVMRELTDGATGE
jgi:uncharacterized damage-inducible protein DinB